MTGEYLQQLGVLALTFAGPIWFFWWVQRDAERAAKAKHGRHYH